MNAFCTSSHISAKLSAVWMFEVSEWGKRVLALRRYESYCIRFMWQDFGSQGCRAGLCEQLPAAALCQITGSSSCSSRDLLLAGAELWVMVVLWESRPKKRKNLCATVAETGERSGRETALQPPTSMQKEGRRFPCSPMRGPWREQAVPL